MFIFGFGLGTREFVLDEFRQGMDGVERVRPTTTGYGGSCSCSCEYGLLNLL